MEKVVGNLNPPTETKNYLINKKVKVVPVPRNGGWLPEDHDGAFMYTGCFLETCLPVDSRRKQLVQILTRDEQAFFEKELFLNAGDLSIYKKKDNFWHTFRIKLNKDGLPLDLADPIDNLKWRVLIVEPRCAPSWEQRYASGAYTFAIKDEEIETEVKVAKANKRKDAYKFLGKIENSREKMRNVLRVYGSDPGKSVKTKVLYTKIDELIEDDKTLDRLLTVINDPHFGMRIFLEDAVRCGAIEKKETRYYLPGGDKIGGTILETMDWLKDSINQDIYLKIKNHIELSN